MSLLTATEVTAVATAVLALLAAATAWFAFAAARAQAEQVRILRGQVRSAKTELDRQADDRRRAQAAQVYLTRAAVKVRRGSQGTVQVQGISAKAAHVDITVHNTSKQPVYDVRVHWASATAKVQAGSDDPAGTLPPGGEYHAQRELPGDMPLEDFTAVASFRDAAGLQWSITPDGRLQSVPEGLAQDAPLVATLALGGSTLTP